MTCKAMALLYIFPATTLLVLSTTEKTLVASYEDRCPTPVPCSRRLVFSAG